MSTFRARDILGYSILTILCSRQCSLDGLLEVLSQGSRLDEGAQHDDGSAGVAVL